MKMLRLLYFLAGAEQIKSYEERQVFLEDMGLTEPGASVLIRAAYKCETTNLFYRGVKEVRAWTINVGSTAQSCRSNSY
jgi:ribosome-binding ATPase YchF (GTP1/OBG family)